MTWWTLVLLTLAASLGWRAGRWSCSRRSDCPRYATYSLARWKRDVEAQVARKKPRDERRPTPPEGTQGRAA